MREVTTEAELKGVSRETQARTAPLSAEEFRALTGASGEAMQRASAHLALLAHWQPRTTLVARSTMADPWRRHMLDSAQLTPLLPEGRPRVADLGSGAGFPGLVLAMLGDASVSLIESDARKCAFLREAARVTGTRVMVQNARIESLRRSAYDVVTARALAPLPQLLRHAHKLLAARGFCLFLKGREWEGELTQACEIWTMRTEAVRSRSDCRGVVLKIDALVPR